MLDGQHISTKYKRQLNIKNQHQNGCRVTESVFFHKHLVFGTVRMCERNNINRLKLFCMKKWSKIALVSPTFLTNVVAPNGLA